MTPLASIEKITKQIVDNLCCFYKETIAKLQELIGSVNKTTEAVNTNTDAVNNTTDAINTSLTPVELSISYKDAEGNSKFGTLVKFFDAKGNLTNSQYYNEVGETLDGSTITDINIVSGDSTSTVSSDNLYPVTVDGGFIPIAGGRIDKGSRTFFFDKEGAIVRTIDTCHAFGGFPPTKDDIFVTDIDSIFSIEDFQHDIIENAIRTFGREMLVENFAFKVLSGTAKVTFHNENTLGNTELVYPIDDEIDGFSIHRNVTTSDIPNKFTITIDAIEGKVFVVYNMRKYYVKQKFA